MVQILKRALKGTDYAVMFIIIALFIISLLAVYSGAYDIAVQKAALGYPNKQLKFYIIGFILFVTISFIDYKVLVRYSYLLYFIGITVLILVLLFGRVENGARRWFAIGSLKGQPSEFFKFVWVLILSNIFSNVADKPLGFVEIIKKLVWLLPPMILVFMQPDFGTALSYFCLWAFVILFVGVKRRILLLATVVLILFVPITWTKLKPYQKMRIIAFTNPEKYADSSGYQPIQSKIAIGSGGVYGKGYLKGTQSHLRFMPERHTDFIFSVIAEEFGMIGSVALISLFFMLILFVIRTGVKIQIGEGKMLCVAIAGTIFVQFYFNVSMALSMAPVVGVPLPMISYGGSSLVTFMAIMGLYNSAHISTKNREY